MFQVQEPIGSLVEGLVYLDSKSFGAFLELSFKSPELMLESDIYARC